MEIPLRLWAVYCRALIVLIIRKFLLPSRQNLPCCSLSPLFLVLSAADMKNRLFVPSAVALSVFEDFHYVFPRSPRGQTEGSRYRQPVLRDGLSSSSGDGRSGTGRACRHGWGELFTVLVPVGVSRGEPGRLGEVVVPSCRRCGECWLQSCWPWGWAPLQNVLHPSVPRLRSCWHGVLCRGVLVGPRWVRSEVAPGRGQPGEESRGQPGDSAGRWQLPPSSLAAPGTCQPRRSFPQHLAKPEVSL